MNKTKAFGSALGVTLLRDNQATPGSGAVAYITNTSASGFQIGDIRRAWLADVSVGSVGAEMITNGDFSSATGWTAEVGWTISGGVASYSAASNVGFGNLYQLISVVAGQWYTVTLDVTAVGAAGRFAVRFGPSAYGADITSTGTGKTFTFQAISTATVLCAVQHVVGGSAGTATITVDNFSTKELVSDRSYKAKNITPYGTLTKTPVKNGAQLVAYSGFSAANYLQEAYSADLDFSAGAWSVSATLAGITAAAITFFERSAASGPSITFGTDATGKLTGSAFDGTTTRTVTSAAVYTGAQFQTASLEYATTGALTLKVNGVQVAQTTGAALLTLNNAAAVCTIGNNRALTAAFPGSIALVKVGATVPTAEQAQWIYAQEQQMFRAGAQVTLPDAGAVTDLTYDEDQDKWVAITAANESSWTGLVRTATAPAAAGSLIKAEARSGIKLLARSTTSPGVDVTIPSYGLRSELVNRSLAAARLSRIQQPFDFDCIGITATTTSGSPTLTSVVVLTGTPYVGMGISGSGIAAGTTIVAISGNVYTLSANATAAASAVAIGQTTFTLQAGWQTVEVISNRNSQREGVSKDFVRSFDGFKETLVFSVSPGNGIWVQSLARRVA
jgi:hypothetical protein